MTSYLAHIRAPINMSVKDFLHHLAEVGTIITVAIPVTTLMIEADDEYELAMAVASLAEALEVDIDRPTPTPKMMLGLPAALLSPPRPTTSLEHHLELVTHALHEWNIRQHAELSPLVDWTSIRAVSTYLDELLLAVTNAPKPPVEM